MSEGARRSRPSSGTCAANQPRALSVDNFVHKQGVGIAAPHRRSRPARLLFN